ncbi:MAG: N-acetylneuraminate synthase family protein [Spirochaetota bacterium]
MDKNTLIQNIHDGKAVFIAEIGLNHNGNLEDALLHVEAAAKAGADAVKFQTFVPELMVSRYADSLLKEGREGEPDFTAIEFFSKLVLTGDELQKVQQRAIDSGVVFFSAPFDFPSVELLETLDVPFYKVASSEVTNHGLLCEIAGTGKPVLMSTGMSTIEEVSMAVNVLKKNGSMDIMLLHCVSKYPVPAEDSNLLRIKELAETFKLPVGFSDHSRGSMASMGAAVAGARVFEKHFKVREGYHCPDAEVSVTPDEFSSFTSDVREMIAMMGDEAGGNDLPDAQTARGARRSLYVSTTLNSGHVVKKGDIVCKRPGVGIPAYRMREFEGRKVKVTIPEDYLAREEYFE